MKIVMLAADSDSTWMVVNALRATYPNLIVGLERPISRWTLLRNRMRRQGWLTVAGRLAFMLLCLPLLRRQARPWIAQLVAQAGMSTKRPVDQAVVNFESVNSPACRAWLAEMSPDAVVVNGTRIISRDTLQACEAVFLNTHCGITPAYRGVHGGYWALANGDRANVGVTVHVVDPGVDTGGIVYQANIQVEPQDNFLSYPAKQYVAAIPLMQRALSDCAEGRLTTHRRDDLRSAIWFHPTLWAYLTGRWLRGVR